MCGINGFTWPDRELVQKMNEALKHRGPDGEGTYLDEGISLGHRRLAIIDLSEKGKQPMSNEDGSIWLVYNGEIFNFQELRKELEQKGHTFRSNTDTEIIIHAYEEWQFQCLDRFNGMFAFALYDSLQKILFLARDRFGIKPLYYYTDKNKIIFSSEIKGILCHPVERKPNDKIILSYLSFSLLQHSNETFFNGIYQLMPGQYLIYSCEDHGISVKQWYQLQVKTDRLNKEATIEKVRDLFTDSVRLRMIADVPVGSCLSGGLDSSSIVCTMRHLSPGGDIRTFSSIFPGQKIDESRYIKEVTDAANLKSFLVSPDESNLLEDLYDLIRAQEEPFLSPSVYAQYKVMKLAHQNGMKVLLDGQGGDEILGGYTYYFGFYFYELLKRLNWFRLSKEVIHYFNYFRDTLPIQMLGFLLLPKWARARSWKRRVNWVNPELYNKYFGDRVADPRWAAKSLSDGQLITISYSSIPHLLIWEDKNSMRWSVEARIPFLDYRFVEMVVSLPASDKLRNGVTKHVFREAMANTTPQKVINRRDKIAFDVPEDKWLKSKKMVEFIQSLIESKSFKERKYWDYKLVKKQFQKYVSSTQYHEQMARDVWRWLNLELWMRQFIDQAPPASSQEPSVNKAGIGSKKILVEIGLTGTLLNCVLRPLTEVEDVKEVFVVRNRPGPSMPKVRYYCPPKFFTGSRVLVTLYKLCLLIYLALSKRPHYIYSFLLFPHGFMAFIAGKLTRRPVGVTLNAGPVELYGIGQTALGVDFTKPIPLYGKAFLRILKNFNSIIVLNSFTQNFLTSHGVSAGKIYIMPQPVNKDVCFPMQVPKKYDVISLGRLSVEKHIEVLLKAVARIKENRPDIKVGIVGDGPSKTSLEELTTKLGINDNVEFLGFKDDVSYYYNSSKIFVLTSEREGGPLTFTEAMACAIPPIASNVGVVADIGQDGSNCIIIKNYDNHIAFAEAILNLLEDEKLYNKLAQNALQTARGITLENATQVWEDLLEEINP